MKRKILLVILILLIVIQFIRPARNTSPENAVHNNAITRVTAVPDDVKKILQVSCYDCHSNNTRYPWYTNIQPVGWWMQHHVNDGKKELNFDEFAGYESKKQAHKLKEVAETVEKEEMPLPSYLIIHKDAKLSEEQKKRLIEWAESFSADIASKNHLN